MVTRNRPKTRRCVFIWLPACITLRRPTKPRESRKPHADSRLPSGIGFFVAWCHERGLSEPLDVTRPVLERYQRHLFHYRQKNGQPLSFRSQHSRLVPIRVWFRWMARQRLILHNPASELELPRLGHRLPKHVLTTSEAERVLAQPDVNDPLGLRDRALLETLYSTGMRRLELANLKLYDLDTERGTLMIRQG